MIGCAWLLVCALATQDPKPPPIGTASVGALPDRLAALPPRAAVAGFAGFQSTSRVEFAAEGAAPHVLQATYVFPERVRWQLAPIAARPGDRYVIYRCGPAFFELGAQQSQSRLVTAAGSEDEEWRRSFAGLELRRALFLWPDGFAWSGEGPKRAAVMESGETLEVELAGDGRPSAIFIEGAREIRETYRAITWRESMGRFWPSTMELVVDSKLVWKERVEALETQVRVLDLYFLPSDVRPTETLSAHVRIIHADVPVAWWVRVPLPEPPVWTDVAARWRKEVGRFADPGADDWKLEPGGCVELDPSGRPTALLLRFLPGSADPPEGLVKVREHTALTAALIGASVDVPACVTSLVNSVPQKAVAGTPYARFTGEPGPAGPMQVVLPFRPAD